MKLKNNKGFTGVDVAVSLVIVLIFVSFIAALFYNLANTSKRIERKSTATYLAIDVIEAMKSTEFSTLAGYTADAKEVIEDDISALTGKSITIPNGYTVKITIANPNIGEEDPEYVGQLLKIITSEVSYSTGKDVDGDGNEDLETVKIDTLVKNIQ